MKKEILIKLLSIKKEWNQRDLVKRVDCTKGYVSKVVRKLEDLNIVTKTSRNRIVVIDLPKLLNYWTSIRTLPKPLYVDVKESVENIEKKLRKTKIAYSLTLFSAAWHRIKLLKVDKIEAYLLKKDLQKFLKLIGKPSPYGKVEIYVTNKYDLIESEKINGLNLVPITQNYVDLMVVGGNGTRVALELAKKFGLFGV